jgi:hypothetical protein
MHANLYYANSDVALVHILLDVEDRYDNKNID